MMMKIKKMEDMEMFEDKYMFKVICAILGFASIFIPGSIVPLVSFVISIVMLVYKIKRAKESPEGFDLLMADIVIVIIVLIVDIGFFAMRIAIDKEYGNHNYSSSSSQEMSATEFAENSIAVYEIGHLAQFSDKGNHLAEIKSGFTEYLENDLGISDVSLKGNKITCTFNTDTIVFTVTKNNIKYTVK